MPKEIHPIQIGRQDRTLEERVAHLERHLAALWDQVWWISLPPERRAGYEAEGYTAPILTFYQESE